MSSGCCHCCQSAHLTHGGRRQNGRHFPDNIFKCIFLNENVWNAIKISLKFVLKGPIYIIPALVQIMAWRRPDDKPLSGPMMDRLPMHIYLTQPQWVNTLRPRQNAWHSQNTIFLMKIVVCWLKFHWNLFSLCQLAISHHWLRKWALTGLIPAGDKPLS